MNAIFDKIKKRSVPTSETFESAIEPSTEEIIIEKTIEEDAFIEVQSKPLPVTSNTKTAFETLIEKEIETMLHFTVTKGNKLSSEIGPLIETKKLSHQIVLYEMLKEAIHPATPKSIHYVNQYRDQLHARVALLKIKLARQFTLISIISILFSGFGYAIIESDIFIDKYIFTDDASFVLNQLYVIATASLGAMLYFFPKLIKQVNNSTLTANKIPFYWLAIFLGSLSATLLINTKVFAPYLIDDTFLHNLFIAVFCAFVADILYGNIQAIAQL
ncbi:hypothetical protein [Flavobacterium anhuiense]|uniref:hypothetical protein n=1 Tax=Flavobacterium anhuiense TaxID=459526 RepID=UPI003D983E78